MNKSAAEHGKTSDMAWQNGVVFFKFYKKPKLVSKKEKKPKPYIPCKFHKQ